MTGQSITWQDPPASTRVDWKAIVTQLQTRPGQWAPQP